MRIPTLIAMFIMTGLMAGCGGGSSSGPTAAAIVNSAVTITGSVVDAASVTATTPGTLLDVTVTAVDVATQAQQKVTINSTGNYSVTLDQLPTKDQTIAITATPKDSSYLPNSTTVTISSTSGVKAYQAATIGLVSVTKDANGVTSKITTGTIVGQDLVVNGATTIATVTSGTTLSDANGNALDNGTLTLTTTMYDPATAAGFAPNPSNSIFASAAFTDVTVKDATGKIAKTASKPVTIRMYVDGAQTYDANGNAQAVKAGDTIELQTYNKSTGVWEQDTKATDTVTKATGAVTVRTAGGKLFVEYTVTHFSYWNLGFTGLIKCNGATVGGHLYAALPPLGFSINGVALALKVTNPSYPTVKFIDAIKPAADTNITLQNVPGTGTTTLTAYYDGAPVGTKIISGCAFTGGNTLSLNIPETPVAWTLQRKCRDTVQTQPLANVVIYDCSPTATTLDGTCRLVTTTNGTGEATVYLLNTLDHLFVQPTAVQKNAWGVGRPSVSNGPSYGAKAVQDMIVVADGSAKVVGNADLISNAPNGGTIQFVSGLWEFCSITGAD